MFCCIWKYSETPSGDCSRTSTDRILEEIYTMHADVNLTETANTAQNPDREMLYSRSLSFSGRCDRIWLAHANAFRTCRDTPLQRLGKQTPSKFLKEKCESWFWEQTSGAISLKTGSMHMETISQKLRLKFLRLCSRYIRCWTKVLWKFWAWFENKDKLRVSFVPSEFKSSKLGCFCWDFP